MIEREREREREKTKTNRHFALSVAALALASRTRIVFCFNPKECQVIFRYSRTIQACGSGVLNFRHEGTKDTRKFFRYRFGLKCIFSRHARQDRKENHNV